MTGGGEQEKPFAGFQPLTSNTTYTPNQVFDVCLRFSSQSAFRLVAHLIRRTLGWVDSDGQPQESRPAAGYADLIARAGISRNRVRAALDEAEAAGFVRLHHAGTLASPGKAGSAALYELAWDPRPDYQKTPQEFREFFEGEGHRTDVPNDYFDRNVPNEPFSVSKVVGAILRFSIGFQAHKGSRRQHVAMSLTDISRYACISSRRTVSAAVQTAIEKGYIVRLEEGAFAARKADRKKAAYALCWSDGWGAKGKGRERSQKDTSASRIPAPASQKVTSSSAKSTPDGRCEKDTNLETPIKNETTKPGSADFEMVRLLLDEGVSEVNAQRLAERYPRERIIRQVEWLPMRGATKSKAGLLVRAIEGDWERPQRLGDQRAAKPERRGGVRHIGDTLSRSFARERRYRDAYLGYLREEERRLIEEQPFEYEEFLQAREAEKARIINFPKAWQDTTLLKSFDGEAARLKALAERFKLMPFAEWDMTENPERPIQTIRY